MSRKGAKGPRTAVGMVVVEASVSLSSGVEWGRGRKGGTPAAAQAAARNCFFGGGGGKAGAGWLVDVSTVFVCIYACIHVRSKAVAQGLA